MSGNLDIVLTLDSDFPAVESVTLCNKNLCLHDVDSRNHFRYGMFNLNARIHFDEIMLACRVVKQEFNRTCGAITYCLCDFNRVFTDCAALLIGQAERRRKFDNLLVSSLDGAVTFIKMNDIAFLVTQNLHFDVLWVLKVFFNENIVNAESFRCFGTRGTELWKKFFFASYDSHSSSAAAGSCLEHNGITA